MPHYDYATLENLLGQALDLVQGNLAPTDMQEVLEYLDAAEYGLAFESLTAFLMEANAPVSVALCALLRDAAHRMNYGDDFSETRNREMAADLTNIWEACRTCAE